MNLPKGRHSGLFTHIFPRERPNLRWVRWGAAGQPGNTKSEKLAWRYHHS